MSDKGRKAILRFRALFKCFLLKAGAEGKAAEVYQPFSIPSRIKLCILSDFSTFCVGLDLDLGLDKA